jgi:DNA modification methylase
MTPYYEEGGIAIYCQDSLEFMSKLPEQSIEAIISDPPYGLEFRKVGWDRAVPDWIDQARRVAKAVIFTTAPTTMWDYPKPDWVCIWHRRAAASRTAQGGFNHWSPILVYGDAKFSIDYYETMFGKTIHENAQVEHPSPKPLELYKWLIVETVKGGGTILDPFMGSGTTLVAAKMLGHSAIGIDINEDYCKEAVGRLKEQARMML